MTISEDQTPQNVQNVAEGASATQINDSQAPVIANPQNSTITINTGVMCPSTPVASGVPHNLPYSLF